MQHSPVVVPLAVRFAVTHEARAALVQKLRAVRTLEAGGVPLQVRGHAHDVLVVDLRPAANARGCASLLCKVRKQMTVINGVGHVIGTLLKKKKESIVDSISFGCQNNTVIVANGMFGTYS